MTARQTGEYMEKLVSVIIPTYNRARTIGRSLKSVLEQTYQNIEVVIVDDGSTDDTIKVISEFKDARVRIVRHTHNKGANAARNTGVKTASGEFIAFQDSDDEWLPDKLKEQMDVFQGALQNVGVVYSELERAIGRHMHIFPLRNKKREGSLHDILMIENVVSLSTALIRRECLDKAGMFDESMPRLQDWDLFIRISRYYDFKIIEKPMVKQYQQPDSISSNPELLLKAIDLFMNKYMDYFCAGRRDVAGATYNKLGRILCEHGQMVVGRRYLVRSLATYPLSVRSWLVFFISLFGFRFYNAALYFNQLRTGQIK